YLYGCRCLYCCDGITVLNNSNGLYFLWHPYIKPALGVRDPIHDIIVGGIDYDGAFDRLTAFVEDISDDILPFLFIFVNQNERSAFRCAGDMLHAVNRLVERRKQGEGLQSRFEHGGDGVELAQYAIV